jgi:zona occludens toxin (predicted ATPase)
MGAAVIGVVFLAGLVGVPSLFGHRDAHANPTQPQATQQAAAQQTTTAPAQPQIVEADANAPLFAYTRAGERP